MAKRIIILDRTEGAPATFRLLYWLDVAASRQPYYARPGAVSVWTGASAGENTSIASGAVVEVQDSYTPAQSDTITQVEAALEAIWNQKQTAFTNSPVPQRFGSFWDSVGPAWTLTNL